MIYHGLMTLYDENGEILEQELYEDGELVEKIK
jgi:antitoxin component YwqK of YwqJK toxin-antitoxin module